MTGDNVYSISGGVFDVNISIANTGTDMFDGFVECSLPQPGTWAVDGASATPVAWDWDLGNIILEMQENVQIAGGETLNISFPATMLDDEWTNFPVTCRLYEGEYNNVVVDSDTAYVLPMPDLQVIKTLQNNPSAAQDVVTFDITIENVGSADAIDFNLRDFILNRQIFDIPLDWGMTFDGQYISHVYQGPDGGFLWQGLSLGAGDTMNIVATLTLDDSDLVQIGTIFENVVTVYGLDSEYTEDNNVSQASGFVESADLYLDIQAIGDDPEHINDPVAFVINYANYGNATGDSALLEARFDHHVFGPGGQYYLRSDMEWATPQDM